MKSSLPCRLPRFQEATEEQVVQILVVQSHEGELDALEFAFPDVGLGRAEAEFADLLPVSVGWRAFAHTGDLRDLSPQIGLRQRKLGECAERASRTQGGGTGCSLQHRSSVRSHSGMLIVLLLFHHVTSLFLMTIFLCRLVFDEGFVVITAFSRLC